MDKATSGIAHRTTYRSFSKPMSAERFNHYALGMRSSFAKLIAQEQSWWADQKEQIIGMVFRDLKDGDFGWLLLSRDRVDRFRAVKMNQSFGSEASATSELRKIIETTIKTADLAELGVQGDEPNVPFDVLRVSPRTDPATLHPHFRALLETPGHAPARAVIKEIGPWLAPSDKHFIEELQKRQFDQRLWELYLWTAFRDLGFDVTQMEAPDFLCHAAGVEFSVEATTVAPSQGGLLSGHPNPKTPEEMGAFLEGYMPIKFGSSLLSKVKKENAEGEHYWERPETSGKPFVVAIADFHREAQPDELVALTTFTQSALWPYLYGRRVDWEMVDGGIVGRYPKSSSHRFREKAIPSGFFYQPGVQNVSAVLFSNAGTIAKFDRMGVVAGFGGLHHAYTRVGVRYDPDPDAVRGISFSDNVSAPTYKERWCDELQIFHNPNAKIPLSHEWLSGIAQFWYKEDGIFGLAPDGQVLSSVTVIDNAVREGR